MCQVMGVDMTEKEITLKRDAGCPEHSTIGAMDISHVRVP